MSSAIKSASIVLGIVGLLNWGYAGYRTVTGAPFADSLPLLIGGLICFTMIVVLSAAGGKNKD